MMAALVPMILHHQPFCQCVNLGVVPYDLRILLTLILPFNRDGLMTVRKKNSIF